MKAYIVVFRHYAPEFGMVGVPLCCLQVGAFVLLQQQGKFSVVLSNYASKKWGKMGYFRTIGWFFSYWAFV